HCSTEMTVTDLASTVSPTVPPCTLAAIAFGTTAFGASNVFTLSTAGAVNVRPAADLAVVPVTFTSISAGRLGSRLVTSIHNLPPLSFAAMASTRGRLVSSCLYVPGSSETGTTVASWKGTYIL